MKIHLRRLALGICFASMMQTAQAALTVNTTRIVFDSDNSSTSVVIANPSPRPYAVQTWVNTAKDDTDTAVPLATSPGLFRLDPGKEQMVQISRLPNKLPKDRETLFYLNVQEIPEATPGDVNVLNIALRTRLKLFYRPKELKDRPAERIGELEWSVRQRAGRVELVVHNPTPYHYTFGRLEVSSAGKTEAIQAMAMARPFDLQVYDLTQIKTLTGLQLTFTTINDYGVATTPMQKALSSLP
ncbi:MULTISPECIES: molecular chaperone [Pseudomonas]|jgi:P pilus assembly chaperone PapD|uniref:Molecular chaperone n=1 Tax=Pseudomonas juntendi TaxID=2666183 RepID=A0A7W2JP60_9PSED|nr:MULTISPECIES: molecular chaperone [Pseudomonas]EGC00343.1 pilus assembly protein [Pseudomonas sp. TJI-51]MBA6062596.1 molecular chaperone [Pseudomonas juntendi]MBA6122961.1 molecular chaperone [Pseudomonas juntendi]MBA6129467.1 molecular chaperone [Pseudomonas juntendi]MBA6133190.1 molecular chaperone [Pseudomonas juntendi]